MSFHPLSESSEEPVMIIAGGWSCSQYKRIKKLTKWGHVIGVNDAAIYAEVHTAITMDRLWLEHRLEEMDKQTIPLWYRVCTAKNVKPGPLHHSFVGQPNNVRMSEDRAELWGSNSGAVALNLAYLMRPRRLYLFGFDMQQGPRGEPHWYPPYPWKSGGGAKVGTMRQWADEFRIKFQQFKKAGVTVKNVNTRSLITAFPTIGFEEFEVEVS